MALPRKVASFTVMRNVGTDPLVEDHIAILDHPAGQPAFARKLCPALLRDEVLMRAIDARVEDLQSLAPYGGLCRIAAWEKLTDEAWLVESMADSVTLRDVMNHVKKTRRPFPHNVFLHIAVQICNALQRLHSQPATASQRDYILHLDLRPEAVRVKVNGEVLLGRYGLLENPTAGPQGQGGLAEYLAPEQTHPKASLTPATDLFTLGSLLYEVLTGQALFKESSHFKTIYRVRRAEVTTELLQVKEILPGLDRVLYRALSLTPRHRYQRAFVFREDLRGLMAGFSFADIETVSLAFLRPVFDCSGDSIPFVAHPEEATGSLLEVLANETEHTHPGNSLDTYSKRLNAALEREQDNVATNKVPSLPPSSLPVEPLPKINDISDEVTVWDSSYAANIFDQANVEAPNRTSSVTPAGSRRPAPSLPSMEPPSLPLFESELPAELSIDSPSHLRDEVFTDLGIHTETPKRIDAFSVPNMPLVDPAAVTTDNRTPPHPPALITDGGIADEETKEVLRPQKSAPPVVRQVPKPPRQSPLAKVPPPKRPSPSLDEGLDEELAKERALDPVMIWAGVLLALLIVILGFGCLGGSVSLIR